MRRSYGAAGTFSLSLSRLDIEKTPGRHPQVAAHQSCRYWFMVTGFCTKSREAALRKGLIVPREARDRFGDLCALLNNLGSTLNEAWPDNRFGYLSEDSLLVKAITPQPTHELARQLRQANSDCIDLLFTFRSVSS